jgi:hypothetical protein
MPRSSLFIFLLSLAALLAGTLADPAAAFERPFPPQTRRALLTPAVYPNIILNGKPRILAPGAQIRNTQNLIEQPTELRGHDLVVNYTEDATGEIFRIWILTAEEIARARPTPAPTPRPAPTGPPSPGAAGGG